MTSSLLQDMQSDLPGARAFRNRIAELLGTYSTCQAKQLGNHRVNIEEAYEHVKKCSLCTQQLHSLEEVRNMRG